MTDQKPAAPAPLACRLGTFDAEARRVHSERTTRLLAAAESIEELPEGWRFRLPGGAETFREVAEWVRVERACCPFLTFEFHVEDPEEPFRLAVFGPAGAKAVVTAELRELQGRPRA